MKRFFARQGNLILPVPPPIPEPPLIEGVGGWGGVYNSGTGVTEGEGGIVKDYTNAITLLNALIASPASTPEIYLYNGPPTYELTTSRYWITGKSNKSIECSEGQAFLNGEIRFTSCNNIRIRNMKRAGLTLLHEDFAGGDDRDALTVNSCNGVHFDHVEVDGQNNWDANPPTDGLLS